MFVVAVLCVHIDDSELNSEDEVDADGDVDSIQDQHVVLTGAIGKPALSQTVHRSKQQAINGNTNIHNCISHFGTTL